MRPSPRNCPRPLPSPQFYDLLGLVAIPAESLFQLVEVLYRFAPHLNVIANSTTPNLITNLFRTSMSTPIPHRSFSLHSPFPLVLSRPLAQAFRWDTSALAEPADSLLRFVTPSPPFSSYSRPLANSLSAGTLDLYAALASYGACYHIAAIASTQVAMLHNPSLSHAPAPLRLLPTLLEARIVRATDPHQTIPDHNTLWSDVTAWSWGASVFHFGYQLRVHDYLRSWSDFWRCSGGSSGKRDFWWSSLQWSKSPDEDSIAGWRRTFSPLRLGPAATPWEPLR